MITHSATNASSGHRGISHHSPASTAATAIAAGTSTLTGLVSALATSARLSSDARRRALLEVARHQKKLEMLR